MRISRTGRNALGLQQCGFYNLTTPTVMTDAVGR